MPHGRQPNIDKFHDFLFTDKRADLNADELEVIKRYEDIFTVWLERPTLTDTQMRDHLVNTYGITKLQAYREINYVKILLGNVTNARKEWQRYKVITMLDEAYRIAQLQEDPKSMIMAADKLGKYTQLDQIDAKELPWDDIIPQTFEPTDDPSVLGLKPIPNLKDRIKKLKEKYGSEIDIEDATYEPGEPEDLLQ